MSKAKSPKMNVEITEAVVTDAIQSVAHKAITAGFEDWTIRDGIKTATTAAIEKAGLPLKLEKAISAEVSKISQKAVDAAIKDMAPAVATAAKSAVRHICTRMVYGVMQDYPGTSYSKDDKAVWNKACELMENACGTVEEKDNDLF